MSKKDLKHDLDHTKESIPYIPCDMALEALHLEATKRLDYLKLQIWETRKMISQIDSKLVSIKQCADTLRTVPHTRLALAGQTSTEPGSHTVTPVPGRGAL